MLQLFERRPDLKSAHVFADHLESTLDLAEELELLHLILPEQDAVSEVDVLAGLDRVGAFVERIEVIELAIAAKLDLARAAARRIADRDARLSTFTKLFHSGTQPLVDLWPSLADPAGRIFDSGHDPLTFLQARGAIDESRCTLEGLRFLGTGEDYLLLGTVKLGAFIELCDTCLKAIDRHYHLYDDDADWEASRSETLEILRERRNEAIRQALGVQAPVIDAPVEILPSDALDEAIDLIAGLTFPEETRFAAEMPEIGPVVEDEVPLELEPDFAEDAPIELPAEAVEFDDTETASGNADAPSATAPDETVALDDTTRIGTPEEIEPSSVIAAAASEVAPEEPVRELASPAERPTRSSLLAPLASARRSLTAFLARRRATAETIGPAETELAADTGDEPGAALVEQAIEAIAADATAVADEDPIARSAVRQRLLGLIASRAAGAGGDAAGAPDADADARVEPESALADAPASETLAAVPNHVEAAIAPQVETTDPDPVSLPDADLPPPDPDQPADAAVEIEATPLSDTAKASAEAPRRVRCKRKGRVPRRRRSKKV